MRSRTVFNCLRRSASGTFWKPTTGLVFVTFGIPIFLSLTFRPLTTDHTSRGRGRIEDLLPKLLEGQVRSPNASIDSPAVASGSPSARSPAGGSLVWAFQQPSCSWGGLGKPEPANQAPSRAGGGC